MTIRREVIQAVLNKCICLGSAHVQGLQSFTNIYVIHADNIKGPWSKPINLGIGGLIDPGHVEQPDSRISAIALPVENQESQIARH